MVRDRNARETRLSIAFHIPSMKGNDVNALDLAADVLGARDDSRLIRLLKKERGLSIRSRHTLLRPKNRADGDLRDPRCQESRFRHPGGNGGIGPFGQYSAFSGRIETGRNHIELDHLNARETVQGTARTMGTYQNQLYDAGYGEKYLTLNSAVTPQQVSAAVRSTSYRRTSQSPCCFPTGPEKIFAWRGWKRL